MNCARRAELWIRVDQATGTITFIDEPFGKPDEVPSVAGPGMSSSPRDTPIQPSSTELMHTRLSTLAPVIHNAARIIDPELVQKQER